MSARLVEVALAGVDEDICEVCTPVAHTGGVLLVARDVRDDKRVRRGGEERYANCCARSSVVVSGHPYAGTYVFRQL
jgi:hypothetical protein